MQEDESGGNDSFIHLSVLADKINEQISDVNYNCIIVLGNFNAFPKNNSLFTV